MSNPMFSKVGRGTDRRTFVRGMVAAAALPFLSPLGAGRVAGAEPESPTHPADAPAFPGLISREEEPQNLEFPFPTLDSFLTPNPRFYVRNHFAVAEAGGPRLAAQGRGGRRASAGADLRRTAQDGPARRRRPCSNAPATAGSS